MIEIQSLQNPKVKQAVRLRERRVRDAEQLFLIEGYRELKRAIDSGRKMEALFFCPEFFLGDNEKELLQKGGGELLRCSKEVFAKISYRDRPDGLLGIAQQRHLGLADLEAIVKSKTLPFLLIAERIEKPGNLGTMLRSSDAAGVDAVIVVDPTTDMHNPNVVRSSIGTLFTLPVLEVEGAACLVFLKQQSLCLIAATPRAELEFTEANFKVPLAIVVGTEQYGLSEMWRKGADLQVKIPMFGVADSLNVASATTLLLYETLRQRRSALLR